MTALLYANIAPDLSFGGEIEAGALAAREGFAIGTPLTQGGLTIFADARIDDRAAICATLSLNDTVSDAEIILAAYRKWGTDCTDKLLGDFAFLIIDQTQNRTYCGRDFVGARQLYYAFLDGHFIASNDFAILIDLHPELQILDRKVAATKLVGGYVLADQKTLFEPVRRLPQAHWMTAEKGEIKLCKYWDPAAIKAAEFVTDEQAIAAGRQVLGAATKDRMRGASKTATHISGGLDSSAVSALLVRYARAAGLADPIGYAWHSRPCTDRTNDNQSNAEPDAEPDIEADWIEAVTEALSITTHAPPITHEGLITLFEQASERLHEPATLIHELPVLDHAAGQKIDTIFSGWGGDQSLSFNGKGYRSTLLKTGRWNALARIGGGGKPGFFAGVRRALAEMQPANLDRVWAGKLESSFLRPQFAGRVVKPMGMSRPNRGARWYMNSIINGFDLTERLESWAQAGRRRGITYVYPLMDRRVAEFALSLPEHFYLRPGSRRWIFRQIMDPAIPPSVRDNDSKNEPKRVEKLRKQFVAVFAHFADKIEEGAFADGKNGERGEIIDLERLVQTLRLEEDKVMHKFFAKRSALQFLNFQQQGDRDDAG